MRTRPSSPHPSRPANQDSIHTPHPSRPANQDSTHTPHPGRPANQDSPHTPHPGRPANQDSTHTPHPSRPASQDSIHTPHPGRPANQDSTHTPHPGNSGTRNRAPMYFSLALILILAGCSKNVTVDNPRPENVTLSIDGDEHALSPKEVKEINLDPGRHKAIVKNAKDSILFEHSFKIRESGIIHTGGTTYYLWRQLYGKQTDRKQLLNEEWVENDSFRIFGDFKIYPPEELYIEKHWDFGLEEELPKNVTLPVTKDFKIQSKIFRVKDLLTTYRSAAKEKRK